MPPPPTLGPQQQQQQLQQPWPPFPFPAGTTATSAPGTAAVSASASAAATAAATGTGTAAARPQKIQKGALLLLAEDCLSLLVVLLTELPRPAGRASARGSLRREVVHRLASSECTHSEVAAVMSNLMDVRIGEI